MAETDGQHGIWLVVKPEQGLLLLLGSVAIAALLVHAFILGHTKWFPAFLEGGKAKVTVTQPAPAAPQVK